MNNTILTISLITIYFLILIYISKITSKKADNTSFFTGNKKSPWYVVSFGMIGASLSGITFISIPGSVAGGQFGYMQMVFGYFFGYMIISFVLMPIYYRLNVVSIYQFLEKRFGFYSYKTGAVLFIISRTIGASIRLLLVASVFQLILFDQIGIPFWLTVVFSILLIWLYTYKGGIKTIIWTDTLQTFFMLTAVIVSFIIIYNNLDTEQSVIKTISESKYSKILFFEDWRSANYFWKQFLGGIFIAVGMTGLDQDMMQKNLTCKNIKDAQKNMISFSVVLVVVNLLFLALGSLLFIYYKQTGIGSDAINIGRTDLLFAEISMNGTLGYSIAVLFLLGLIAAAYSSADSALTSLTTSVSIDLLNIDKQTEEKQNKTRKKVHIIMSIVLVFTILILRYSSEDSAIWLLIKLAGFTYGPLIGLFFFGIISKRIINDKLVAYVSAVIPIAVACFWYMEANSITNILGNYVFGAELIIINAVLSFVGYYSISKKANNNNTI
ncbi:MAG: sodium:solute symporter [Flavobacteriaceae bacterium]|nr:sodium:solute symporter [Flavobacteriaceae bacterium]